MALEQKSFVTILRGMIAEGRSRSNRFTDFSPGSVMRTFYEAVASEIESLYQSITSYLRSAIPIAVYSAFGLSRSSGESDAEMRQRFIAYLRSIPRSTVTAIQSAVIGTAWPASGTPLETVISAQVIENHAISPYPPPGFITIYIWGSSGLPSATLISRTQAVVDGYIDDSGSPVSGYKPAGIIANVVAATANNISISLVINVDGGLDPLSVANSARLALIEYVQSMQIGEGLSLSRIISICFGQAGVNTVSVSSPASDVVGAIGVQVVSQNVTVTIA